MGKMMKQHSAVLPKFRLPAFITRRMLSFATKSGVPKRRKASMSLNHVAEDRLLHGNDVLPLFLSFQVLLLAFITYQAQSFYHQQIA
ncbi:hypothetical protein F4W66_06370 [Escherichia coli]|nr:hypothetical protein F4W66_06370 [Escherichia coli]